MSNVLADPELERVGNLVEGINIPELWWYSIVAIEPFNVMDHTGFLGPHTFTKPANCSYIISTVL
jgi:hypothetical protein